ncbi:MAG: hypothetical protein V4598_06385 [Bdellovibrionota bacterium]
MLKIFLLLVIAFEAEAMSKNKIVPACKDKAEGPCYEFPGRARLYNNRDIRIWKKGTNRLYQIANQTEKAYSDIKHLSQSTEINANFNVCLLKPETPSGIADICVESVKDMKTSQMPE